MTPSAAIGAHHLSASAYFSLAASASLVTLPWWRVWLRDVSEIAGDVAPIAGLLIAFATLYHVARGGDAEKLKNARTATAGRAADAIGTAAKRGGPSAALALGAVAIVAAIFTFLLPKREALAAPPTPPAVSRPRKRVKSADDAGEDGSDDSEISKDGPAWHRELVSLLGSHEGTSRRPNPVVQALFRDSGFPGIKDTTKTAWCAAGVNAALERHGIAGTKSLAARSFENWGKKLDEPRLGCIVVMWRGSPKSWQGHVGTFVKRDATHVYVLGGNQSDSVTVAKFPLNRVLGYRWPRSVIETKTVAGAVTAAAGGTLTAAVKVAEHVEPIQAPLANVGPTGAAIAAWLGLAIAVITVVGAVWAIHGRADVNRRTGA